MTTSDPLLLRCIALTGSFETALLPPACFSKLAGDFDGQGLSFSALQWNIGQQTLQPLLLQMYSQHPEVMLRCFGVPHSMTLQGILGQAKPAQLAFARSLQSSHDHKIMPEWGDSFSALGASPEWQLVAQQSAGGYFDHAKFQAKTFGLVSDRAIALLFDIAVQDGGVPTLARDHILNTYLPSWGEPEKLRCIAGAIADVCNPRWRRDVLERKLTVANGSGVVHGLHFDLSRDFAL